MDQNNTAQTYEKTFKQFILGILAFAIVPLVLGAFIYHFSKPFDYFFLILIVANTIAFIIAFFIPVIYIKKIAKVYFIFLMAVLYPLAALYSAIGRSTTVFWLLVLPVCIYAIFSGKKALRWLIWCFCLLMISYVLAFVVVSVVPPDKLAALDPGPITYFIRADMINAGFASFFTGYNLYYMNRFHQIRIVQVAGMSGLEDQNETDDLPSEEEKFKYEKIYAQIEMYFETKQPYLQADFRMAKMANELNINAVYLTKAIRLKRNMNLNSFVNFYRIEYAKKLIHTNSRQYTLQYIYLSSGFKSHSSFNMAFKQKEGITPSEYCKKSAILLSFPLPDSPEKSFPKPW